MKRNVIAIILTVSISLFISEAHAQQVNLKKAEEYVRIEKDALRYAVNSHPTLDSNLVKRLNRFIDVEVDSIRRRLVTARKLPQDDKVKGVRSLEYVMKNIKERLNVNKLDLYEIPNALESYKKVLHSLMFNQDYLAEVKPLGEQSTRLIANTFWQCKECNMLDDLTTYKRIASAPDFILINLEKNPNIYFRDSLLFISASASPVKMINYLRSNDNELTRILKGHHNPYVQKVVSLSTNKNADDLSPFIKELTEGSLSEEQILKERADVNRYFALLVNTMRNRTDQGSVEQGFHAAMLNAIKEKSLYFYVRTINDLHDSPDAERFASVKDLRPQDIYYLIVTTGEELYTSSFLGLYKRMMDKLKGNSSDAIFTQVNYDQFHKFIRLASNYNVVPDFMSKMEKPVARKLLNRFIGNIETNTKTGLERAMDVADLFTGVVEFPEINKWVHDELKENFSRVKQNQQYFGSRLYSILLDLYDLVQKEDPGHPLWTSLGNHELLSYDRLKNKNGKVIHQVMFYGDKDGIASYQSFMNLFSDNSIWEVQKKEQWTEIRSRTGQPVELYANLPLSNEEAKDILAQKALAAYLDKNDIHPAILIHRGHSYHLSNTFERLQPSVKMVLLGSCGGYNNNLAIANFSPDAQVIVSKKVGSKHVNDPMIAVINSRLLKGEDIVWKDVWNDITRRLQKDAFALSMFNEYIPPAKNLNIFVLKLFNQNTTAARYP